VVEQAAARGLAAIAITDHDVLSGLAEARVACVELGVELIDGIELTADWNGRVCHILGYGINAADPALNMALAAGETRMAAHVDELLAAIRASGQELSRQDLARYNTRYATGTAVVLGMIEKGVLRGAPNARELLALASREPRAYTAAEAIELIHGAGGLAALAHPARLRRDQPLLTAAALAPLREMGLDGLEVWHIVQPEPVRQHYRGVARCLGLLEVGGSDCHGPRSTGIRLGGQQVPIEVFSALRDWLSEHPSGPG
jgi:predicted metal-dependent phosphoesterase TrpH